MSLAARARTYWHLGADLWRWRRSVRPLRAVCATPVTRTVLLCDLMSMVGTVKVETLFAAALRAHGFMPVLVLQHPWRLAEGLFRAAAGAKARVLYLNDHIDEDLRRRAAEQARSLLAADSRFERLVSLEIDGVRIGRNVMSMAARRFRIGHLDPDNADHRILVERTLADSIVTKEAVGRLLDLVSPDLALFNERGYTPSGEMFDVCLTRGIDVVQWLGAPQSDHLLLKRYDLSNRDMHPLSLSDGTWAAISLRDWTEAQDQRLMQKMTGHYASGAWFNRQQLQTGKEIKPPAEVKRQLGLDPAKKTAVIFCHILYDATFFYGDSLFADYERWLVETVRCAIGNPRLNWVIKVHPVNVWRSKMDGAPMEQLEAQALRREFGELPDHVRIMPADTDINTFSLFNAIDYGLTVRGTIGMELPCFGIPVITAGTGRYAGRGFTVDPESVEEYRAVLARLDEMPPLDEATLRLARLYAFGTFFMRPVPITSFRLDASPNRHNIAALSPAVEVVSCQGKDLPAIAEWMAESRDHDFLNGQAV